MGLFDFLFGKKSIRSPESRHSDSPFVGMDADHPQEQARDSRHRKSHHLLLSRFLQGQQPANAAAPYWENVLGESPQKAIHRFIADGMIVPASLPLKLDRACKATDLKALLKSRGLPVSGKKEVLIERLVAADREGMQQVVAHLDLFECSPVARTIAEGYLAERHAEKSAIEAQTLNHLRSNDFRAASLVVAAYEAKQVFPRGLGVDWAKHSPDNDIQLLEAMVTARPRILDDLAEKDWRPLSLAACMMHLWGTRDAKAWLPDDFTGIPCFDHDTTARMMLFHARHLCNLANYRAIGVKQVIVRGCGEDSCAACRTIAEQPFPINEAPELPHAACTHGFGCRCHLVAEFER